MCAADEVWMTELTLIQRNKTFMRKSWLILKIIGQCDVKHILMSQIKNNNASFEDLDIHYH